MRFLALAMQVFAVGCATQVPPPLSARPPDAQAAMELGDFEFRDQRSAGISRLEAPESAD